MSVFRWFKRLFISKDLPFDIQEVESALEYHFQNPSFLYKCLKHRSYAQAVEGNIDNSNERLEFLGDSVLSMVVSHHIFLENPDFQEGDLTKLRSILVSKTLAVIAAKKIGLSKFILLNDSEENAGGRNRTSIIADTFEAVIGAIYLDGGYDSAKAFIERTILEDQDISGDLETNYKSNLLEMVQANKMGHPLYRTVSEKGPDHKKIFTVEAYVNNRHIGTGRGKSKKAAQQMAAKDGLLKVNGILDFDNNPEDETD
ncbi:ribonuclease III [Candidatus Latescibacterota bacterium]